MLDLRAGKKDDAAGAAEATESLVPTTRLRRRPGEETPREGPGAAAATGAGAEIERVGEVLHKFALCIRRLRGRIIRLKGFRCAGQNLLTFAAVTGLIMLSIMLSRVSLSRGSTARYAINI